MTLVIGHRGARGYVMESSLASFQKALDLGVDYVELDVWQCKSGETVVFHDQRLDHLSSGTGLIVDYSWQQLQQVNLKDGSAIPTLQQVLDLIDHECAVNIELKGSGTAAPVAQIITNYLQKNWSRTDFLVTSFNQIELVAFHQLLPQIPFGPILEGIPLDYANFAQKMGATHLITDFSCATPEFIVDAQARQIRLWVYTVNYQDDIDAMLAIGVDGIISDYPDRICAK